MFGISKWFEVRFIESLSTILILMSRFLMGIHTTALIAYGMVFFVFKFTRL